jgi:hypothetical protein
MKKASLLLRVKNGKTRRGLTSQPSRSYTDTTNKLTGVNMTKQATQLNDLASLLKLRWQDSAVEATVGLLSTVVTDKQIQALINSLRKELRKLQREELRAK